MRLLAWGITALLGTAGISALLAQTVDELDVQAIKKRSADLAADAQAFVDQVKNRGDEFREEAVAIRESGTENMRQVAAKDLPKGPAGPIDFAPPASMWSRPFSPPTAPTCSGHGSRCSASGVRT